MAARVLAITVYPVRSASGRSLADVRITEGGLDGDRVTEVVGHGGAAVRGKDAPALAGVPATGDPDADAAAVRAVLGPGHELVPARAKDGVAPVHLVSRQAIERAAGGEVPEGCSAEDPRANVLLDLEDDDERGWVGRSLQVGEAVLQVTRTPKHCLGVYADVLRPGVVRTGDPVVLV